MSNPKTVCIRKFDNSAWTASISDDYAEAKAMRDAMENKNTFYFRGGTIERKGWWIFLRWVWVPNSKIWQPTRGEFSMYTWKGAVERFKGS